MRMNPADVDATEPPMLGRDLLSELERHLADQEGDLLASLAPGLEPSEIEVEFGRLGIAPSQEALAWWGWRDGGTLDVVPGLGYIPLAAAVDGHTMLRSVAGETAAGAEAPFDDPDAWWHPAWVPIFDTGGLSKIALDCSGAPDDPSPVRQIDWDRCGASDFAASFAPSLGEYISRAVGAIAASRYRYDAAQQTWLPWDWAHVPAGERF